MSCARRQRLPVGRLAHQRRSAARMVSPLARRDASSGVTFGRTVDLGCHDRQPVGEASWITTGKPSPTDGSTNASTGRAVLERLVRHEMHERAPVRSVRAVGDGTKPSRHRARRGSGRALSSGRSGPRRARETGRAGGRAGRGTARGRARGTQPARRRERRPPGRSTSRSPSRDGRIDAGHGRRKPRTAAEGRDGDVLGGVEHGVVLGHECHMLRQDARRPPALRCGEHRDRRAVGASCTWTTSADGRSRRIAATRDDGAGRVRERAGGEGRARADALDPDTVGGLVQRRLLRQQSTVTRPGSPSPFAEDFGEPVDAAHGGTEFALTSR